MAETIQCPTCKKSYRVAPNMLGQRLRCRECGKPFLAEPVPPTEEDALPQLVPDPPAPSASPAPKEDGETEKKRKPKRRRTATRPPQEWIELDQRLFKHAGYLILLCVLGLILPYFGLQFRRFNRAGDDQIYYILAAGLAGILTATVPLVRFGLGSLFGWFDDAIRWMGLWVAVFPIFTALTIVGVWRFFDQREAEAQRLMVQLQGQRDRSQVAWTPPPVPSTMPQEAPPPGPRQIDRASPPAQPRPAENSPDSPVSSRQVPAPAEPRPAEPPTPTKSPTADQKPRGTANSGPRVLGYERLVAQFGAERVVRVVLPDTTVRQLTALRTRLMQLADMTRGANIMLSPGQGQLLGVVGPVADLDAFVSKIDFGSVDSVDREQRIVTITVDKSKLK